MDTGGRDNFSDFGGSTSGSGSGGSGSGAGGAGTTNPCSLPIEANLEEVAICDYWISRARVPSVGTSAILLDTLVAGRLTVTCEGSIVGYLPVRYNYVARECIPAGVSYAGEVLGSEDGALPSVTVVLRPQ